MIAWEGACSPAKRPLVVGDFNVAPTEADDFDDIPFCAHGREQRCTWIPTEARVVWTEIDREARKGKPTPSDHAPVLCDVDDPGSPLDAGWSDASARIAKRREA